MAPEPIVPGDNLPSDWHEHEGAELRMSPGRNRGLSAKEFEQLLGGRPGWRLEPRSTPGAGPLWCFVFNGKIEYSVEVQGTTIHLYVMDTDREIVFPDGDSLMTWLRANRAEAAQEPVAAPTWKSRRRRFTQWS